MRHLEAWAESLSDLPRDAALPPALDETLVAGAMLLLVMPALGLVDSLSLAVASKKAEKAA